MIILFDNYHNLSVICSFSCAILNLNSEFPQEQQDEVEKKTQKLDRVPIRETS